MAKEFDEYVEKDPEVFNSKVKTEVDFALLRISEKRYKAEKEVESLKEVLAKKNAAVAGVGDEDEGAEIREWASEDASAGAGRRRKVVGSHWWEEESEIDEEGEGEEVQHEDLDVREDLSEQDRLAKREDLDEEDAFWYQNEVP
eukprot:CAMPEP_0202965048 /NCGR_PEP_ID=MMETSP1396-20130829/9158_1 /ASSEMBLY_ACC=CAM_ASM_000872 /TAXON_ID= /ORGANISM="Pseudokeronopsis sp., Strain Brazil" /LENGTH=143 /DNA_ID=CAMNT_0049687641 /DNA_START=201 /DNA_END=632 /DNA_ORIENTATION=-